MNNDYRIKASWVVLLLLSLGASITLNLFSAKEVPSQSQVDLASEGWLTLNYPDGRIYFYKESVGTVKQDTGERAQEPLLSLFSKAPLWFIIQLVLLSIGLLLVLFKNPFAVGFSHRLNIAFGYLLVVWANLVVSVVRFNLIQSGEVPLGYVRVVPYEQGIQILPPEALSLLALGFGTSILLSYLWIRWARASRPEEYFL
jgi:hypothetical protein